MFLKAMSHNVLLFARLQRQIYSILPVLPNLCEEFRAARPEKHANALYSSDKVLHLHRLAGAILRRQSTIQLHILMKFKRILLKLSGESLMGEQGHGIDTKRLSEYAAQIKEAQAMGIEIGIVIGGGNIFRGLSGAGKGFDRVKGDQMGMCATVINSLALSSALGAVGVKSRVLTAIRMEPIGEFYSKWKAIEALERGEVVIMSAGTGNPYFTTDTGSSLRGIEIEADVMLKGTRVDGVYTADPEKEPTATKFSDISYDEVLQRGLRVMDITATAMCKENNLPIYVFNMDIVGNLKRVLSGEDIGTYVHA